jgi:hypothetical protein
LPTVSSLAPNAGCRPAAFIPNDLGKTYQNTRAGQRVPELCKAFGNDRIAVRANPA